MSRKRAITTFLSQKFMITRLSIAFEDFLGSSIAPQDMPPCDRQDSQFFKFYLRKHQIATFLAKHWEWGILCSYLWKNCQFSTQEQINSRILRKATTSLIVWFRQIAQKKITLILDHLNRIRKYFTQTRIVTFVTNSTSA